MGFSDTVSLSIGEGSHKDSALCFFAHRATVQGPLSGLIHINGIQEGTNTLSNDFTLKTEVLS